MSPRNTGGQNNSGRAASATARGAGRSSSQAGGATRRARRKRGMTRRMRRFEGVLAQMPVVQINWADTLRGVQAPDAMLPTPWHFSKALSLLLLLAALASISALHMQDPWFVYEEDVQFTDLVRLDRTELYPLLNVEGLNIFWVDPRGLRRTLSEQSWVDDARIDVSLPAGVTVHVQETQPVAVWQTNSGVYWVAQNGFARPVAEDEEALVKAAGLPMIVDSLQEARVVRAEGPLTMDPNILDSALALMQALPELDGAVRYNRSVGLNFPLSDPSVWVYWGDGFDLDLKLGNFDVLRNLVRKGEDPAQILDVRFVKRPYIR